MIQDANLQLLHRVSDADINSQQEDASTIEFPEYVDSLTIQRNLSGNVQDVRGYLCDHPIIQITHCRLANADGQT